MAAQRSREIVKLLLDHGANPHMTDKYGKTPLELAWDRALLKSPTCWLPPRPEKGERPSTPHLRRCMQALTADELFSLNAAADGSSRSSRVRSTWQIPRQAGS